MKKMIIRMTNGDEIVSENAPLEVLTNAINSKHIPKFLALGKPGSQYLVNVKQIAYAKEVEE